MTNWRKACVGAGGVVHDGDGIVVSVGNGRQHRVEVATSGDSYELQAVVARRAVVDGLEDVALAAWRRNRATSLVGFRINKRGQLVGRWLYEHLFMAFLYFSDSKG